MGYSKDAVKGIAWLSGLRIATRALSFIKIIIIARILTPAQFGLFGVATISLSLLEVLTETGIEILLTQQKKEVDEYIDTLWIVSIARGFVIALLIVITSPLVTYFFQSPEVKELIYLISLVAMIKGFINPAAAKFIKNLNFKTEFFYRTAIFLVETSSSLILTLLLHSPVALVWGMICGAVFEMFLSLVVVRPWPHLKFKFLVFSKVLHDGKWITLAGIFSYLYLNLDNIVVGKILGTVSLGIYDMAYKISMLPISEITDVVGKSTFPIYVRIKDEPARLRKAFFKTIFSISLLTIPACAFLITFPQLVVSILLGNQWLGVAPILQLLAIYTACRSILTAPVALFYGLGKQQYVTRINFISFLGLAITIFPLIKWWGLNGATAAVLLGMILSVPLVIYYSFLTLKST